MTLRVTVEIIPFGNEDKKYEIGSLEISNLGQTENGVYNYIATQFSDGYKLKEMTLSHNRNDGSWQLIRKVLNLLENN